MYCPNLYKGIMWHSNPRLFYLGMQDQFYTFSMFDAQAWYTRDMIMGNIKVPSNQEIDKDINLWLEKEGKLANPIDQIDFQTEYTRDLCSSIDYPKMDLDKVAKDFKDWEHYKEENILTYRDHSFTSPVTGSVAPVHHTTWLEAMDDSMKTFLATK